MHWIEICAVDCPIYYVNTRLSLPSPLGSGTPLPSRVGSTAGTSRHPRLETELKFTQQRLNFQPVELKFVGLGDPFTRNQLNRTKI